MKRCLTFNVRKDGLGGVAIRTKLDLAAGAGKTVFARVTENHGLGIRDLAR